MSPPMPYIVHPSVYIVHESADVWSMYVRASRLVNRHRPLSREALANLDTPPSPQPSVESVPAALGSVEHKTSGDTDNAQNTPRNSEETM